VNFSGVEQIAAAILYEGYILYPYRPTAIKNRQRWNFGTLYPRDYAETQRPAETYQFFVECLALVDAEAALDVKISCLQLLRELNDPPARDGDNFRSPTDRSLEWEQAVERTWERGDLRVGDLIASPATFPLEMELGPGAEGCRQTPWLQGSLSVAAELLPDGACRFSFELQNLSAPCGEVVGCSEGSRTEALLRSFVSAHMLLRVRGGEFISLLDPGERYVSSAQGCRHAGVFPVLVGEEPERTMLLCSPIILYDYPKIAPESAGDFFDGTEMDEMLTLRVLTLTDAEKAEMRAGDARARRILERTEALTAEGLLKAHGIIRGMRDLRGES
jgi:hypothetical protein